MKGFIVNEGERASFKLKKPLPPGSKLPLDYAYLTVGEKSGKKEDLSFVKWLRENYFPGEQWGFYKEDGVPYFSSEQDPSPTRPVSTTDTARGAGKALRRQQPDLQKENKVAAKDIIESSPEQAKILIDKCSDRMELKKALQLSKHFSKKEQHMRYLIKRIEQVY